MRGKTLAILLITLAVVAGAGVLLIRSNSSAPRDGNIGEPLLQDLPVNDIAAVQMKSAEASTALAKKGDRWVVEDRHDYPADFSKLTQMVRQLKDLKVGNRFEASRETLRRLGLEANADPSPGAEENGLGVLLKDKDGTVLAHIRLGKPRTSGNERPLPDGQYVRIGEDPTVFLVDRAFSGYSADPASWLDKKLTEVAAAEVKKISCTNAGGRELFALERSDAGKDLSPLMAIPKGRHLDKGSVNRVAGGLSSLRLEDVEPDGQGFDQKEAIVLEYQLLNGMIYRLYPGTACKEDKRCPIRIRVEYQPPGQSAEGKSDKGPSDEKSGATPEPSPEELASRAKLLDARLTPWVFYVPKWQHDNFLTSVEQLLQKPQEETTREKSK